MRRLDVVRGLTVSLLVVATLASKPAWAQASAVDWAFGHPAGEVGLALGSALSLTALWIPQRRGDWGPSVEASRDDDFGGVSDVTGNYIGSSLLATAHYGLEVSHYQRFGVARPGLRALRSSLVDVEAFTLSIGITSAIKALVGRCRPRAYHDGRCGPEPEHDAFPSGHATPVAALAGTQLTFALRSDHPAAHRFALFGAAETMALATAALRMLAGAHSWEDVLAAWAVGHGTGALVQLAHPIESVGRAPGKAESPLEIAPPTPPFWLSYGGRF